MILITVNNGSSIVRINTVAFENFQSWSCCDYHANLRYSNKRFILAKKENVSELKLYQSYIKRKDGNSNNEN